ncbi:Glycosyl hydrolases family 2, TIM barrel domain [Mucilaginibacter mallensis]|uniref:Glycosyl hydrolases family 2, TIM barrel domain n=2 Tax=Mucilaginibacter mallensis TaxID=652787 RepID=A0A1H1Y7T9_MUCMA|nr:Glycosyl hydrolases family 2, TIM barrel domain [Mucilaginibacter mallensis]
MRKHKVNRSYRSRLSHQLVFMLFMVVLLLFIGKPVIAQQNIRQETLLNNNWRTIANERDINAYKGFEKASFPDKNWLTVDVPHNWDNYGGYRRLKHGNLHGYAWYRKVFTITERKAGKRYFLWFEGVGSYATVWLNGTQVGYHAGGRTTFTIDVTNAIKTGNNLLCVRADHPAFIKDLPWVCGGCSDDPGFSEGSQPMGIFRPVHLIVTDPVRIEPFGIHVWNDTTVSEQSATLNLETEVKNYTSTAVTATVINKLIDAKGNIVAQSKSELNLVAGGTSITKQIMSEIKLVHLWSLVDPYLYTVLAQVVINGKIADQTSIPYGIRWISWPIDRNNGDNRFYLNGKPIFINGIAEYEHMMGNSAAFSNQEIKARVMQLRSAGFNAFRDAHQPHNLEYQKYWDKLGILWWPQYSAHIWYDTPEFRENYKALLRDWVKERRNSPSVILWGLQNESRLPEDFAKECSAIICSLDPTASTQRKITTCNGGKGTDWDVPQNWSGTYGGNPLDYAQDLQKDILVGEYGAWRSIDLHTEGLFNETNILSEDRMSQLLETKVRLAESAKQNAAGQFMWLLYSHENPGRVQGGEGERELDRVGPVNYKGLFTVWGQPLDAYYMYRANYADKLKEPMVYIVSHTWPNRWLKPGKKDSISVYSNCDEVELFNNVKSVSLGKKTRQGIGTHFQWDGADIKYNVLYAVGYVNGKAVAQDYIILNHLPEAPHLKLLTQANSSILKPAVGYKYLYRVNCGGPDYRDKQGNLWMADAHQTNKNKWGSTSWTDDYAGMPAFFGSQQRTFDPIRSTDDAALFQSYRFGMNKLKYSFPVPDGNYKVELYFTEPWYGIGGGMDCAGWRMFDVAVNNKTVIKNLDIWKETGTDNALKKTVAVHVTGGQLQISFPHIASGEAIISAIAISTLDHKVVPAPSRGGVIKELKTDKQANWSVQSWLDIGQQVYAGVGIRFSELPPALYGADWIKTSTSKSAEASFTLAAASDVYVAMNVKPENRPGWLKDYLPTGLSIQTDENGGTDFALYKKRFASNANVVLGAYKDGQKYTVAVLPVTTLEPATDLKRSVNYGVANALIQGDGAVQDTLDKKKIIHFTQLTGGKVILGINPGVADSYALRFKYYNASAKTYSVNMQLQAADGTIMKTEVLSFKPLTKGKSGAVSITTGSSINAGNYKVILTAVDADGLIISGFEMQ